MTTTPLFTNRTLTHPVKAPVEPGTQTEPVPIGSSPGLPVSAGTVSVRVTVTAISGPPPAGWQWPNDGRVVLHPFVEFLPDDASTGWRVLEDVHPLYHPSGANTSVRVPGPGQLRLLEHLAPPGASVTYSADLVA